MNKNEQKLIESWYQIHKVDIDGEPIRYYVVDPIDNEDGFCLSDTNRESVINNAAESIFS